MTMTRENFFNMYLSDEAEAPQQQEKQETPQQIMQRITAENLALKEQTKEMQEKIDTQEVELMELSAAVEKQHKLDDKDQELLNEYRLNKKKAQQERTDLLKALQGDESHEEVLARAINCIYLLTNQKAWHTNALNALYRD